MQEDTFAIVCKNGEIIIVKIDILKKIHYFQAIFGGGYREASDKTLVLDDISKLVCENIFSFLQDDKVTIPASSIYREECLGLGQYWNLDNYIDVFLTTFVHEYGNDKGYIIEIINQLALTKYLKKHHDWMDRQIEDLIRIPRLHMLCSEAIIEIVNLYLNNKKYNKYLFPLLRDWYLFDRDKDKVTTLVTCLDPCPLYKSSFVPIHQTTAFIESFPDPCLAKKIALWTMTRVLII